MVLVGLSIVVLLSLWCYTNLLSPWHVLGWLGWGTFRESNKESTTSSRLAEEEPQIEHVNEFENKADLDRKAMPPPDTLRRLSASAVIALETESDPSKPPMYTLTPGDVDLPSSLEPARSLASLPAQNSIQHASAGRGSPRTGPIFQIQSTLQSTSFPSFSPPRGPVPSRLQAASPSSLAIPPTHHSIPPKPRKKVILLPGHSPLDWAYLSSSTDANLRGLPPSSPYLRVTPSLLRQHTGRKGKNAWTALGGKVYNITPYLPYHPGGELELMKAAGRDGTKLFGEVHPWINWEGMLEPCLVGVTVGHDEGTLHGKLEDMD